MATETHPMQTSTERQHDIQATARVITGGSLAELIGGAAGVVLAILGLSGILPRELGPIAAIAVGAALLLQGGAMATRFQRLLTEATQGPVTATEIGGGVSVEFVGGGAAITLGVLALLNVQPFVLLAVAAIVLGGTVLLSSGSAARLNALSMGPETHQLVREIAREAVNASAGAQVLVGGGAIVLGILSLVGIASYPLSLVAFLAVGGSALLSGAALSGRLGMLNGSHR